MPFAEWPPSPTKHLGGFLALLGAALGVMGATGCGSDPCTGAECAAATGTGGSTASGGTSGSGGARSGPCASDTTCDTEHGFGCVAAQCRYPCSTHFDCEGQGLCDTVEDESGSPVGTYCALSDTPEPAGQYYTRCPSYTECDSAAGFSCLGAGVGDADAVLLRQLHRD